MNIIIIITKRMEIFPVNDIFTDTATDFYAVIRESKHYYYFG